MITEDGPDWLSDLPLPRPRDYETEEDREAAAQGQQKAPEAAFGSGVESKSIAQTFDEAINAMRSEDYDSAIPFFEKLSCDRPQYHIAWLRLGVALREKGVRVSEHEPQGGVQLLRRAVQALTKAAGHVDADYQAQALYERSKARFQILRFSGTADSDRQEARKDAEEACRLSPDPRFASWLEFLEQRGFSKE